MLARSATEGRPESFDLATDSAELRDLAHTDEKRVTALRDALADRAADLPAAMARARDLVPVRGAVRVQIDVDPQSFL